MKKKIYSMLAAFLFGLSLVFVNAPNVNVQAEYDKRATFKTCWGNGSRCEVSMMPDGSTIIVI